MIVYLNGEWVDARDAKIAIDDRGFTLADGVFETARLIEGKYFRLQQHLDRLAESAATFQLEKPSDDELRAIFQEIAVRNDLREASLRVTITRGPPNGPQTLLVMLTPVAAGWREKAARGWSLVTARTLRPPTSTVPAKLKSLGRPYSILAKLEAQNAGVDDALLLSADGYVAEGPTWNFFWRSGRIVRTATLDIGVLEGVTRSIILNLAEQLGYQVEIGRWRVDDVRQADEAFASMTSLGVVPIRSLDGRPFPSDDCAAALQHNYWDFVMSELSAS